MKHTGRSDALTNASSTVTSEVSDELMKKLLQIGAIRSWRSNQVLHWSGECPQSLLCVREGRLRMRRFDSAGHEQILSWFGAGGFLALAGVIANKPFHFDIVTDSPCKVLHVARADFMELLRHSASASTEISLALSERLLFVAESHVTHANEALSERVWLRLTRMAQQMNGTKQSSSRGIPLTQQELADAVGASRYRVGMELNRLAERGLISMSRGCIRVLPAAQTKPDEPTQTP